jgi:hypothetical protein
VVVVVLVIVVEYRDSFACYPNHETMKSYEGNEGEAPDILNLFTRWKCVVIFTIWSVNPCTYWSGSGCGGTKKPVI